MKYGILRKYLRTDSKQEKTFYVWLLPFRKINTRWLNKKRKTNYFKYFNIVERKK